MSNIFYKTLMLNLLCKMYTMTTKLNWTPDAVKLLIYLYEENEFLYNAHLELYKDRDKRTAKYVEIAEALKCYIPDCSANDVKKKINGLRSQYLAEKMKIGKSKKRGSESGSIYKPSVYWFQLLSFLDYVTKSNKSQSNIEDESNGENTQNENEPEPDNHIDPTSQDTNVPARKKRRSSTPVTRESDSALLSEAMETIREMSSLLTTMRQEDSFEVFGKYVACELREISYTGNQSVLIRMKRKIQQAIMDAWETLDEAGNINVGNSNAQNTI